MKQARLAVYITTRKMRVRIGVYPGGPVPQPEVIARLDLAELKVVPTFQ